MGDYNDGKLPWPCLRLDFGDSHYASIELGEGTGYLPLAKFEELRTDLEALRAYARMIRELLVDSFQLTRDVWDCAPLEDIPVDYARRLNGIYAAMQEAGVSVDTAHAAAMLVTTPLDSLLEKALQRAHYGDAVDIPKLAETIRKTVQSEAANEQR